MPCPKPLALAALVAALVSGVLSARSPAQIRYRLDYDPAVHGRVVVEMTLPQPARVLVMPRAVPMGYGDVPYDRWVRDPLAFDAEGRALEVAKDADGPRWQLGRGPAAARRVRYAVDVDAQELEILTAADSSKARPGYLGLLGYSVFAFAEGFESRPVELVARGPDDWPVLSTLAPQAEPGRGAATARARDYYGLADSQLIMGPDIEVRAFQASVPLFVVQYAEAPSAIEALGQQAVVALDALTAYFDGAPMKRYTVHAEFVVPRSPEHGYGFSMEHMESCTIFADTSMVLTAEGGGRRGLYNLAHHMAHSWIPKRCAGPGYFPFCWEVSPVLDSIWFSEGWGQYVAAAALAEEGGMGDGFRQELVRRRFRIPLRGSPAFLNALPLAEVSRIASTRYAQDFRTGRNVFARGGLMAFEIDEAIRAATGGEKSLADLVRRLMVEGAERPLDLDRLPASCEEVTGVDVGEIFRRWLGPVR